MEAGSSVQQACGGEGEEEEEEGRGGEGTGAGKKKRKKKKKKKTCGEEGVPTACEGSEGMQRVLGPALDCSAVMVAVW